MAYERKQAPIHVPGNAGPRLDRFELDQWVVGDTIEIPLVANKKGKMVPRDGFNVKAANELHAPKKFRKWKDEDKGVLFVQRVK